jgi:hypothetical protein
LITTAISEPLWNAMPWLRLVQFPWRFLTLAAFGASLASAFAIDALSPPERGRTRLLAAAFAVSLSLAAYGSYARPQFVVYGLGQEGDVHGTWPEARRLLEDPTRHQDGEARASLATLIGTGQSGTSVHEYMPAQVTRLPVSSPERRAEVFGGGRILQGETIGPNHDRFTVAMDGVGALRFHQFFFAGWRAVIDGKPAPIGSERGSGLILVPVPAGVHVVEVAFGSTPVRQAASAASALALLALGFVVITAAARLAVTARA